MKRRVHTERTEWLTEWLTHWMTDWMNDLLPSCLPECLSNRLSEAYCFERVFVNVNMCERATKVYSLKHQLQLYVSALKSAYMRLQMLTRLNVCNIWSDCVYCCFCWAIYFTMLVSRYNYVNPRLTCQMYALPHTHSQQIHTFRQTDIGSLL